MTNYTWIISAMECVKKENDLNDVVITIHWRYNAEKEGFNAETYGATSMPLPTGEEFTPYEELTKDQVVGWLVSELDVDAMNKNLNAQIELLINPINVTLQPPFEN
jgi:hypothetical protein